MVRRAERAREACTAFAKTALPRTFSIRTSDPTEIDHPDCREFADQFVWVATLEAGGDLEELVFNLVGEERRWNREPLGENPTEVVLSVLTANFKAADQ